MIDSQSRLFTETQSVTQRWAWIIAGVVAAVISWGFIQQVVLDRPFGNNPAPDWVLWVMLFLVGGGLPLLLRSMQLKTTLLSDRIVIRFFPLHTRTVYYREIHAVRARQYRPIREYGGWGIRWSPIRGMACNMSGDWGVQLEIFNGRQLLIGSQRADDLASAIRKAMGLNE